jgi:histidinol phosphatase-like PHP family hydrolase
MCGLHTLLEIVEIAAGKGMRLVNISDHGSAAGKKMNFWVLADKKRRPERISSSQGKVISVLAGIETNILDIDGNSDFPHRLIDKFDLVSAGFHHPIGTSADDNTTALENYLARYPLDLLTHPCIATFSQNLEKVVTLALEHGFALEVNNTNLRLGKTDVGQLERLIALAKECGALLVENSDGHSFFEIGENDEIEALLKRLRVDGDEIFINRDDRRLDEFLAQRKRLRE